MTAKSPNPVFAMYEEMTHRHSHDLKSVDMRRRTAFRWLNKDDRPRHLTRCSLVDRWQAASSARLWVRG